MIFFDRIAYIHGFGSSSNGNKSSFLAEVAKELSLDFIAVDYDSSTTYKNCLTSILSQIPKERKSLIIGTSLGAFYAIAAANELLSPCIVLNPSLDPFQSLGKYVNKAVNGVNSNAQAIESYKGRSFPVPLCKCIAMFETGDEILDHQSARNNLVGHAKIITIEGGSHRFENYDLLKAEIIAMKNSC